MAGKSPIDIYGPEVLAVLKSKGWTSYKSTDVREIGEEAVYRRGPATKLEIEERYESEQGF